MSALSVDVRGPRLSPSVHEVTNDPRGVYGAGEFDLINQVVVLERRRMKISWEVDGITA